MRVKDMRRYEECATRLENRGWFPPTKEYADILTEGIQESGLEAHWSSAVDPYGTPFFDSNVFPVCHPAASREALRYLIEKVHRFGTPILSWYPLNLGGGVLAAHPDWRMEFYDVEGVAPNRESEARYACLNSPYGELLPRFAVEVVKEVGFDGLWFDSSTMSNHGTWPMYQPGCRCGFCRDRFRRDSGLELPEKVDLESRVFRLWVNWRYDVLMGVWKAIVDAVHDAEPRAVVCFNNYRRRNPGTFAWNTAIPLRRLGMDMIMSSELDGFPSQADIQMKVGRAYDCARGAETWWPLCDHWNIWVPDVEPLTAVQASLGCISAGGVSAMGVGVDAKSIGYAIREVGEYARPRMAFVGGETVEYVAILASQQTMDFGGDAPLDVWDEIHGANEFCRHAHLQSSVVFDDHIGAGSLADYGVLIIGNATCLSAGHGEWLEDYVKRGGVLVACCGAGTRDELGYPHAKPVLDELLGIGDRQPGTGAPTLEIVSDRIKAACGPYVTFKGPHVLARPFEGADVLALTADRTSSSWDGSEQGAKAERAPRYPGVWTRAIGRGHVVYFGVNCFRTYLQAPVPRMLRLLRAIVVSLSTPPVTLQGPLCVTVNTRAQSDGRWAVHLHNAPGSLYAYPAPQKSNYLHAPGEVLPVRDLVVEVAGVRVTSARSGLSGEGFVVEDGRFVKVPELRLHDVVLLEILGS